MIDCLYDCFKYQWSYECGLYVYSDTHFGDEDMQKHFGRISDEDQLDKINSVVQPRDVLLLLGDVGEAKYLKHINCNIVLLKGNHDKGDSIYQPFVDEIFKGPLMISPKIMLSHEPCLSPYWFNIHGHIHDNAYFDTVNELTVTAERLNYKPMPLKDIIKTKIVHISDIHSYYKEKRNALDNKSKY